MTNPFINYIQITPSCFIKIDFDSGFQDLIASAAQVGPATVVQNLGQIDNHKNSNNFDDGNSKFNVLLTVHHAMILGNCPT